MPPPQPAHRLRLAVSQSHTLSSTALTLAALEVTARRAAHSQTDLILFPEAYLGGYPRTATFGAAVGARRDSGREQFRNYFNSAVDLGDTPAGAGEKWTARELETPREGGVRGDGTREELERVARETGVFLVVGCVERAGGTLYCAVVYVCPRMGCIGKRRKVMPTGSERLIWGQGQPSSLRAITTTIRGVKLTLAAAICWENYMPLLRQSLYSQNVNLYLAPTADARDTWLSLMRTVACEGRCVVLSANQCMRKGDLPRWITGGDGDGKEEAEEVQEVRPPEPATRQRKVSIFEDGNEIALPCLKEPNGTGAHEEEEEEEEVGPTSLPTTRTKKSLPTPFHPSPSNPFISRGGSCIISPLGEVLAGPLWEDEDGLVTVDVDMEDCVRGRLDMDVGGHYSRSDAFRLTVEGLDLSPPP